MKAKQKINDQLAYLYGDDLADALTQRVMQKIASFSDSYDPPEYSGPSHRLDESDVIMITYGDMVKRDGVQPLQVMKEILDSRLHDMINIVHILPFFPFSSDDGFSVIDYQQVNPALGTWEDIRAISENNGLMFDVVVNHISQFSAWFEEFKKGNPKYANYFICVDPKTDLSDVFRPRALPLLTKVETAIGEKWVWTTFSDDQIDLNFAEPEVLLEVLDVFLFYISQGARCIRLDAVGFIWKEIGTSCLHLPQAHAIIQLTRTILDVVAPHIVLITETNVPHQENISYFGDGKNEAQMVYNFSLPPLVLHSIQTGDGSKLLQWAKTLQQPTEQITFFNFLASHDGVGLLPAKGILTDAEIVALAEHTLKMGGKVSYKNNPDGTTSPYEMNINYLDATRAAGVDESVEKIAKRFLASQSIMLALRGVPGIYYHSLFGSQNWLEGIELTGMHRSINREKLNVDDLQTEIDHPDSLRHHVFFGFKKMLTVRRNHSAFDPHGEQLVIDCNPAVFGLLRTGRGSAERILCLTNLSDEPQRVQFKGSEMVGEWLEMVDLFGGKKKIQVDEIISIELSPYQVSWMLIK